MNNAQTGGEDKSGQALTWGHILGHPGDPSRHLKAMEARPGYQQGTGPGGLENPEENATPKVGRGTRH